MVAYIVALALFADNKDIFGNVFEYDYSFYLGACVFDHYPADRQTDRQSHTCVHTYIHTQRKKNRQTRHRQKDRVNQTDNFQR